MDKQDNPGTRIRVVVREIVFQGTDSRDRLGSKNPRTQESFMKKTIPFPTATHAAQTPLPAASSLREQVKRSHRGLENRLLVALIVFNLACLAYYLFFDYQFRFHSDSAVANLLAQEMFETGQYFPRDWNYVFGDLWVLSVHTWVLPFLPFFPNGYALHAAGGVIGSIFIGIATWSTCAILGASRRTRLIALALISAGFTPGMSEHIFGQQAYGTSYYMVGLVLVCGWRFMHAQGPARWRRAAALAAVTALVIWPNPQRGLVYFLFPLFAGALAAFGTTRLYRTPNAPPQRQVAGLFAIGVLGIVAGIVLHRATMARSGSMAAQFTVNWTDFPTMVGNVVRTLHGFIGVIGGLPVPHTPVATAVGLFSALKFVAALTVLVLLPFAVNHLIRSRHPGRAFVAAAAAASFAASFFIFVTSTLAVNGPPEDLVRYMVPGLVLAMLVLVTYLVDQSEVDIAKRVSGLLAVGVLVLSAPFTFGVTDLGKHLRGGGVEQVNPRVRLAHFLEAQGLRYGYATFWHAGRTTVLSNSVVRVRQIQIANGLPQPMRHLSSNRWYESKYWEGPTFIMLAADEVEALDLQRLSESAGAPVRQLAFEDFRIYVFDHNIAADLPGWTDQVTEPLQYRPTSGSAHAIGHYVAQERTLTAAKGEAGALHFGPYRRLRAGRYLVTFDLSVDASAAREFGAVDVTGEGGRQLLAKQAINQPGKQRIILPVTLKAAAGNIEFRVFSSGAAKMTLSNIELANDHRN